MILLISLFVCDLYYSDMIVQKNIYVTNIK